jgi:tetratricopeptide (TPR) repeat protein
MYCDKCGTEIRKGVKFCPGCGKKIEDSHSVLSDLKPKKWNNKFVTEDEERITAKEYLMTTNVKDWDEARRLLTTVRLFFWWAFFALIIAHFVNESEVVSSFVDIINIISFLFYLWLFIVTAKWLKAVNSSVANTLWLFIPICWLFIYPMIADPLKTILGIRKPPYRSTFTAKKSPLHSANLHDNSKIIEQAKISKWKNILYKSIGIIILLWLIGLGIYWNIDGKSIQLNNDAMESFNNWDSQDAIKQLQDSKTSALTNENKLNTLINLAYVQSSESQDEDALKTFKEALVLSEVDSFDYYLVTAEIAALNNDPEKAIKNYNLAYKLNEKGYQVNNALTLFYIDLEDKWGEYVDYPKALFFALRAYEFSWKTETAKQNLAIAYFFNEDYDKTISLLSSSNLPKQPMVWLWLALSYHSKGDSTNAKLYLTRAIDNWADIPQEYIDLINS